MCVLDAAPYNSHQKKKMIQAADGPVFWNQLMKRILLRNRIVAWEE